MPNQRSFHPGLGGLALAAALLSSPALAQGNDPALVQELLRRIDALQRRIDALESERRPRPPAPEPARRLREAERATAEARAAAAEARRQAAELRAAPAVPQAAVPPAAAPPAAAAPPEERGPAFGPLPSQGPQQPAEQAVTLGMMPGSFRIPGTGTSVRLYGFAVGIATQDFGARNRSDVVTAQSIPLSPSAASRQGGDFRIDGRRSRLGLETLTQTSWGPFRTVVEFDFAGSQSTASLTSQSSSSSWIPRLRLAYGELGPLLIGQYWSLFFDDSYPQRLDYATPFGVSNVRQAQFRYTHRFANGISLAASIENPYTDATLSSGVRFDDSDPLTGANQAGFTTTNRAPDVLARLRWDDPALGHVALTGVVRPALGLSNRGEFAAAQRFHVDTTGWGLQLSASARVAERDRAYLRLSYGGGIGRYLDSTSNGQGIVSNAFLAGVGPSQVRVNEVKVLAGVLGYTHYWLPDLRSNATIGWASLSYPAYVGRFATAGRSALNRQIGQGVLNLIWSPIPRVDLGVEYLGSTRSLETPLEAGPGAEGAKGGVSHRVLASGTFRF